MQVAIGIRRPVLKNERVIGGPGIALPFVEIVGTSSDVFVPGFRV